MGGLDALRARITARFGLRARESWPRELEAALEDLGEKLGLARAPLLESLERDPALLTTLAGKLTVEETYFYRQAPHFEEVAALLRDRLERSPEARPAVWSAGCSTGEEPYSVAIALREALPQGLAERVVILATDLRAESIRRAQLGCFGAWSFRGVSDALRARYFTTTTTTTTTPASEVSYQLAPEIRRAVTFVAQPLEDHLATLGRASLTAILFRNVAVYLETDALARLYRGFARVLEPGGVLFIAATDPPPRDLFVLARADDTTVLRSAGADGAAVAARPPTRAVPLVGARTPWLRHAAKQDRAWRDTPPDQPAPTAALPTARADPESLLAAARRQADRGDIAAARATIAELLQRAPAPVAALRFSAELHLAEERHDEAVDELRRALYLDPGELVCRYLLALSLVGAGRNREAYREVVTLRAMIDDAHRSTAPSTDFLNAVSELEERFR